MNFYHECVNSRPGLRRLQQTREETRTECIDWQVEFLFCKRVVWNFPRCCCYAPLWREADELCGESVLRKRRRFLLTHQKTCTLIPTRPNYLVPAQHQPHWRCTAASQMATGKTKEHEHSHNQTSTLTQKLRNDVCEFWCLKLIQTGSLIVTHSSLSTVLVSKSH